MVSVGQKDFTVAEHEALMREKYADFISQDDFMLAIIEKKSGTFIGGSGLHFRNRDPLIFESGYWLATGYEGKGYVNEVVRKITAVGFETLAAEKLIIRADEENLRSQASPNAAATILMAPCVGMNAVITILTEW